MHVVSLVSPQERCAKTTLAAHIALQAHRSGVMPVALVDADEKGDLSSWAQLRRDRDLPCVATTGADLPGTLNELEKSGVKLAVIDTASDFSSDFEAAIAASDLILMPINAGDLNVLSIIGSLRLAESRGKPLVFVFNRRDIGDEEFMASTIELAQHGTIAPVVVPVCPQLPDLMKRGESVLDQKSPSEFPIAELWDYILGRLNRASAKPAFAMPNGAASSLRRRVGLLAD
jgi:chromosome partitioning protein